MEIENNILEKIQKLLNLQHGAEAVGSLHEAELAAVRVHELLLKYNLDIADVTGYVKPEASEINRFDEEGIINPKNEGKWIHNLYSVLCRHNFCKMVINVGIAEHPFAILIGTKVNVESVKFLGDQLENRIRIAEKEGWRSNYSSEKRGAFRRGFFLGAVKGIDDQLKLKKLQEEANNNKVTALVVSMDKKLNTFMENEFNNLRPGKASRTSSRMGVKMGYEKGRSMNINSGITGNTARPQLR
jgi:hypothetical protein